METVTSRCTQCGKTNSNSVPAHELNFTGSAHGTEVVFCVHCSGECDHPDCEAGDPCEQCYTETVQNRCGGSVPTAQR